MPGLLLSNSLHSVKAFSVFLSLFCLSMLGVGKTSGWGIARIAHLTGPKGYSIPYNITLSNKDWGRGRRVGILFSKVAVCMGIDLPVGGGE